jgi:hypothetical protein
MGAFTMQGVLTCYSSVIEQDHDLSENYIKGLSTADLLAIKRHLHKTDGSSYYSRRHSLGLLGLLDALLRTKRR